MASSLLLNKKFKIFGINPKLSLLSSNKDSNGPIIV
jgi:hypothetical protein